VDKSSAARIRGWIIAAMISLREGGMGCPRVNQFGC
jgi:hypothetical protein